jgi:hypothetical protein
LVTVARVPFSRQRSEITQRPLAAGSGLPQGARARRGVVRTRPKAPGCRGRA